MNVVWSEPNYKERNDGHTALAKQAYALGKEDYKWGGVGHFADLACTCSICKKAYNDGCKDAEAEEGK